MKKYFNNLKIEKNYTPYNSSWLKFGASWITSFILDNPLPMTGYFAHNVYAGYQYDQSKTAKATLKVPGGKIDVILKPQDYDAFKIYNVCGLLMHIIALTNLKFLKDLGGEINKAIEGSKTKLDFDQLESALKEIYKNTIAPNPCRSAIILGLACIGNVGMISKVMHLFSPDELQYQIISAKTGEVIDQKYITKIITQDDYELGVQPQDIDYNEYVMAAAA